MPYSITTKDGIVISGIPDDVPPDAQELKDRVAKERSMRSGASFATVEKMGFPTQAGMLSRAAQMPTGQPTAGAPAAPQVEPETTAAGVTAAALRGMSPTAAGAAAGALMGAPFAGVGAIAGAGIGAATVMLGDLLTGPINTLFGTNFQSPSEAVQHYLTQIGVPEPQSEAEKIVQSVSAGIAGAMTGVGAGQGIAKAAVAGAAPLTSAGRTLVENIGKSLAASPRLQALMGATGGAGAEIAGQAAQKEGATPEEEMLARLFGGVAGGSLGGMIPRAAEATIGVTPALAAKQEAVRAAEQLGIPVPTTDVFPPKTALGKTIKEQIVEKIPVIGTQKMQAEKQKSVVSAIEKFLDDYGAAETAPLVESVASDLVKTREATIKPLVAQKKSVIDKVAKTGTPVDTSNTRQLIARKVQELSKIPGDEAARVSRIMQDMDKKISEYGSDINVLEAQRKAIGEELAPKGPAVISTAASNAKNELYAAVREDMTKHIKAQASPEDFSKWQKANELLAKNAKDLDDFAKLRAALNSGEVQSGPALSMLRSQDRQVAQKLVDGLSEQGKANARAAIVSDIAEKSGGIGNISPERFLTQVKRQGTAIGVTFTPEQMSALKGLQKAVKLTLSGQTAVQPIKTGWAAVPALGALGSWAALGPQATAVLAGSIAAASRIYESAPVRNALMQLAKVQPGSKQELELAKNAIAAMNAAAQQQPAGQQEASAAQ